MLPDDLKWSRNSFRATRNPFLFVYPSYHSFQSPFPYFLLPFSTLIHGLEPEHVGKLSTTLHLAGSRCFDEVTRNNNIIYLAGAV